VYDVENTITLGRPIVCKVGLSLRNCVHFMKANRNENTNLFISSNKCTHEST